MTSMNSSMQEYDLLNKFKSNFLRPRISRVSLLLQNNLDSVVTSLCFFLQEQFTT